MSFSLTLAPSVFTKMILVVISFLRRRGIDIHINFDDSLLLHFSEVELSQKTRMVISLPARSQTLSRPRDIGSVPIWILSFLPWTSFSEPRL